MTDIRKKIEERVAVLIPIAESASYGFEVLGLNSTINTLKKLRRMND